MRTRFETTKELLGFMGTHPWVLVVSPFILLVVGWALWVEATRRAR